MNVEAYRHAQIEARAFTDFSGRGIRRALSVFRWADIYEFTCNKWPPLRQVALLILARLMGCKVVRYWIGSDVMHATTMRRSRRWARWLNRCVISGNVAVAFHLADELKSVGIEATVLPMPIAGLGDLPLTALPERPTIVSYVPSDRRDFYGGNILEALADEFKDVEFVVVAASEPAQRGNIRFVPLLDREALLALYGQMSILLRPTQHDGLARMVMESLAMGRNVIWSMGFPHCLKGDDLATCRAALRKALEMPQNIEGRQYVLREYSIERTGEAAGEHYRRLLGLVPQEGPSAGAPR